MVDSQLRLFVRNDYSDGGYRGISFLYNLPGYLEYLSAQGLVPLYPCTQPYRRGLTPDRRCDIKGVLAKAVVDYLEDEWDEKQGLFQHQLRRLICSKCPEVVERNHKHLGLTDVYEEMKAKGDDPQSTKRRRVAGPERQTWNSEEHKHDLIHPRLHV